MASVKILLADDHAVVRSGLRHLLVAQGWEVVGEAATGLEAIAAVRRLQPDLVLLDLSMPGLHGLDVLVRIRAEVPWVKVLILTMHDDPGYLRQALAAGASGYVPKAAADTEVIAAIRTVVAGGTYVYPTLASRALLAEEETATADAEDGPPLSQRETQVLQLLALGYTNQEIADQLAVGVRTVETYRRRILDKLNLHTRAELVRYALTHRLIQG